MKYKRVLVKLSGEALAGEGKDILSAPMLEKVAGTLLKMREGGRQVAVVVGAGNIWRGKQGAHSNMEPNTADHMGMLGTVINSLAIKDATNRICPDSAAVMTSVEMNAFAEPYSRRKAEEYLCAGKIVIFGCGTGSPFFTTDTAAALRAIEIGADILLMAKNVDGVYDDNPKTNPLAKKYSRISYQEVLAKNLAAADNTASALCLNNDMPMILFELKQPENMLLAVSGEPVGTYICKE